MAFKKTGKTTTLGVITSPQKDQNNQSKSQNENKLDTQKQDNE